MFEGMVFLMKLMRDANMRMCTNYTNFKELTNFEMYYIAVLNNILFAFQPD